MPRAIGVILTGAKSLARTPCLITWLLDRWSTELVWTLSRKIKLATDGHNSPLENHRADPAPHHTQSSIQPITHCRGFRSIAPLLPNIHLPLHLQKRCCGNFSNYCNISCCPDIQKWLLVGSLLQWRCFLSSRPVCVLMQTLEQYCHGPQSPTPALDTRINPKASADVRNICLCFFSWGGRGGGKRTPAYGHTKAKSKQLVITITHYKAC